MQRVEGVEFRRSEALFGRDGEVVESTVSIFVGNQVIGVAVVVCAASPGGIFASEYGRERDGKLACPEPFVVKGLAVDEFGSPACVRGDCAAAGFFCERQRENCRGQYRRVECKTNRLKPGLTQRIAIPAGCSLFNVCASGMPVMDGLGTWGV